MAPVADIFGTRTAAIAAAADPIADAVWTAPLLPMSRTASPSRRRSSCVRSISTDRNAAHRDRTAGRGTAPDCAAVRPSSPSLRVPPGSMGFHRVPQGSVLRGSAGFYRNIAETEDIHAEDEAGHDRDDNARARGRDVGAAGSHAEAGGARPIAGPAAGGTAAQLANIRIELTITDQSTNVQTPPKTVTLWSKIARAAASAPDGTTSS